MSNIDDGEKKKNEKNDEYQPSGEGGTPLECRTLVPITLNPSLPMDQFLDQETKIKGRTCGQIEIQLKIDYKWSVDR